VQGLAFQPAKGTFIVGSKGIVYGYGIDLFFHNIPSHFPYLNTMGRGLQRQKNAGAAAPAFCFI
jgi:hypothetical protein